MDNNVGHRLLEEICKEVGVRLVEKPKETGKNHLKTAWGLLKRGLVIEISKYEISSRESYSKGGFLPFLGGVKVELSEETENERGVNIPFGSYNIRISYE
ncbi:TPA: hypothetical protein HA242_03495 [Candidatus Woesearchaeota archaeon]|nr:hypothetical protein [Candidatus Woesearchaeota archaeon]HIG92923.1 hypothetical protein [Candidatus Woesearchaeota archaeon]HIH12759.1 hypothetical protein [Candidatus Woesearchaeota archaeon]